MSVTHCVYTRHSVLLYIHVYVLLAGPSTQTNIEQSAAGIDQVVTFGAGPDAPNTISIMFNLTDDDVALEAIERYVASLSVVDSSSGVIVTQPSVTTINVLDDDGVHTVAIGDVGSLIHTYTSIWVVCSTSTYIHVQMYNVYKVDIIRAYMYTFTCIHAHISHIGLM